MIKILRNEVLAPVSGFFNVTIWIHQTAIDWGSSMASLHEIAACFVKSSF